MKINKKIVWMWMVILVVLSGFVFTITSGQEFQVDEFSGGESDPVIWMDSDGNFVVTWVSDDQDDDKYGVYSKRFDSNGGELSPGTNIIIDNPETDQATGNEFRVNTHHKWNQWWPEIAISSNGNFIVVFQGQDINSVYSTGISSGILAKRYDSNGQELTPPSGITLSPAPSGTVNNNKEFVINSYTSYDQLFPDIAMDTNGNFVVVWQSNSQDGDYTGVYAKRYNSNGQELNPGSNAITSTAQGKEFRVNTQNTNDQEKPKIAMAPNGDFVIVWESYNQDGGGDGIYAKRYYADGREKTPPAGSEIVQGNEFKLSAKKIAFDSQGNFITISTKLFDKPTGGQAQYIVAQRYDANGDKVGAEIKVNNDPISWSATGWGLDVTMESLNDFTIVWEYPQGGIFVNKYVLNQNPGTPCGDDIVCTSGICDEHCCSSECPEDGWHCDGDFAERREYFCDSSGACDYTFSSRTDCNQNDQASGGYFCSDGDIKQNYKDGYCDDSINYCKTQDTQILIDDCDSDTATDTDSGKDYTTGGSCINKEPCTYHTTCPNPVTTPDNCISTNTLYERFVLNNDCSFESFQCSTLNSCSGDCPGCVYNEYSCFNTNEDYCKPEAKDPDTDSSYCNSCLGDNKWDVGGDISSGCCGDDSSEFYSPNKCDGVGVDVNACCDNENDFVNKDGQCVEQCCECEIDGQCHPTETGKRCNGCDYIGVNDIPVELTCDGIDEDCDGNFDEGVINTYYQDNDDDNYGDPVADPLTSCGVIPSSSYSRNNMDCNDADEDIYPNAPEECDGKDNDCNSETPDICAPEMGSVIIQEDVDKVIILQEDTFKILPGSKVTIIPQAVADNNGDTLSMYCKLDVDGDYVPVPVDKCSGDVAYSETEGYSDLECVDFSISGDDGNHELSCKLYDNQLYSETQTVSIIIDSAQPEIQDYVSAPDGLTVSKLVKLEDPEELVDDVSGDPPLEIPLETQISFTITTDEPSRCKYDTEDKSYEDMRNTLTATFVMSHTKIFNSLLYDQDNNFYIRCEDEIGNFNTVSYKAVINLGPAPEVVEQTLFCEIGSSVEIGTDSISFEFTTDEDSICKYSDDENKDYDDNEMIDIDEDYVTDHTMQLDNLKYNLNYKFYVKCKDDVGNINIDPYIVEIDLGEDPEGQGISVFHISDLVNAQAELASEQNYDWHVYCRSKVGELSIDCADPEIDPEQIVVRLSDTTNAHVEQGDQNNYANDVCLSNTDDSYEVDCMYSQAPCAEGYTCVASLSSVISAHVSSCAVADKYSHNICCKQREEIIDCSLLTDNDVCDTYCIYEDPECVHEHQWPIGIYEPYCCNIGDEVKTGDDCMPGGVAEPHINCETEQVMTDPHLHTFEIQFEHIMIESGTISCDIDTRDGSDLLVPLTVSEEFDTMPVDGKIELSYTLKNTDNIDRTKPWIIKSCSIETEDTRFKEMFDEKFADLDEKVYVHGNTWTGLINTDDDAYRAYYCYYNTPGKYFDNDVKCDWVGDLVFAKAKSKKFGAVEIICDDEVDNDGTGDGADCADSNCHGIAVPICPIDGDGKNIYSSIHPKLSSDSDDEITLSSDFADDSDMLSLVTGLFSKVTGEAVAPIGSVCKGNICEGTLSDSNIKIWYTQHVNTVNGIFKMRFDLGIVDSGSDTSTTIGNLPSPPQPVYGLEVGPLKYGLTGRTENLDSFITTAKVDGHVDQVMSALFTSVADGITVVDASAIVGGDPIQDKENIKFYADTSAPVNNDESDSNVYSDPVDNDYYLYGTIGDDGDNIGQNQNNPCNDGIDNDLDYKPDCKDPNCYGEVIGKTAEIIGGEITLHDDIKCEAAETTCWDGYDNDHDGLVDCADEDCDGKIGAYVYNNIPQKFKKTGYDSVVVCEKPEGSNNDKETAPYYDEGILDSDTRLGSCSDKFDNDADNNPWNEITCEDVDECIERNIDCYDLFSCWGKGDDSAPCPLKETICDDGVDNDFDYRIGTGAVRFGSADNWLGIDNYKPYGFGPFSIYFTGTDNGADCFDYDCKGKGSCPLTESVDHANCFDGYDNDLDAYVWSDTDNNYVKNPDSKAGIDCQDFDCLNVENPNKPGEKCYPSEFNLFAWDVCKDGVDNDYDDLPNNDGSKTDGRDNINEGVEGAGVDCYHRTDYCGVPGYPGLSVHENINVFACADKSASGNDIDNDLIDGANCADHGDCDNMLGSYSGARCVADGDETGGYCGDGLDNDADGKTDCEDADCHNDADDKGSRGQTCVLNEASDTYCSDGYDNDADGHVDCLDIDCYAVFVCDSEKDWSNADCLSVPYVVNGDVGVGGSVSFNHQERLHMDDNYALSLSGSKAPNNYDELTIFVGENDVAWGKRFPYDTSTCSLQGTNADYFIFTKETYMLALEKVSSASFDSFDVEIVCTGIDQVTEERSYVVDVSATSMIGLIEEAESKSVELKTQVYENTPPIISDIHVSGLDIATNTVELVYEDKLEFRGLPNADGSGICGCEFTGDITEDDTGVPTGGNCITSMEITKDYPAGILPDGEFKINARATDGAGNIGGLKEKSFNIIVKPKEITENYELGRIFYNSADYTNVDVGEFKFITATNREFKPDCKFNIKKPDGTLVKTYDETGTVTNNELSCTKTLDLVDVGVAAQDGMYLVNVEVSDKDKPEFIINSKPKIFFVCNNENSKDEENGLWDCQYLDMDNDGVPEGLTTTIYDPDGVIELPCDNCPEDPNPEQGDWNANGLGDVCDCGYDNIATDGECDEACEAYDPDCGCHVEEEPCYEGYDLKCPGPDSTVEEGCSSELICNSDGICDSNQKETCACVDCYTKANPDDHLPNDACVKGLVCNPILIGECMCDSISDGFCPTNTKDFEYCSTIPDGETLPRDPDCLIKPVRIIYPGGDPDKEDIVTGPDKVIIHWAKDVQDLDHKIYFDLDYTDNAGSEDEWHEIVNGAEAVPATKRDDDNYIYYELDISDPTKFPNLNKKYQIKITPRLMSGDTVLQSGNEIKSAVFSICRLEDSKIRVKVLDRLDNDKLLVGANVKIISEKDPTNIVEGDIRASDTGGRLFEGLNPKENYNIEVTPPGTPTYTNYQKQSRTITTEYCKENLPIFKLDKCGDGTCVKAEGEYCTNCEDCDCVVDESQDQYCDPGDLTVSPPVVPSCKDKPSGPCPIGINYCWGSTGECDASEGCCCEDCYDKGLVNKPWKFCDYDEETDTVEEICACYLDCDSVANDNLKTECENCQQGCAQSQEAKINVDLAENIITTTKIVTYKGKPVKMKIVVWN